MGVRLIKGIKIFEGMRKKSTITSQTKRLGVRSSIIFVCCAKIFRSKLRVKFLSAFKYKVK